ncbi:MAG TPA: hypothetical protein VEL31_31570 [Ktedonobacteraceae bacterium]|nr:hypothetical protein [Ktedonobacteraceae bacterium]
MKTCQVCQEKSVELVPVADTDVANALGFLLVCGECACVYQEDHFEDLFRSPIDFDLLNRDWRVLRRVA